MHIRRYPHRFDDIVGVIASVYPHATPDADPRFLASSPSVTVYAESGLTYQGRSITVEQAATEAAELILAICTAERLAGNEQNRDVMIYLAQQLAEVAGKGQP